MRNTVILALLISLFHTSSVFAKICGEPSAFVKEESHVDCVVEDLIDKHFPNLAGKKIEFREFNSREYYFKSSIKLSTIRKKPGNRTYVIYVNPAIYINSMTFEMLSGVLTHELIHIDDFSKMSRSELALFLSKYHGKFKRNYEHQADRQTLEFGYAHALKAYRSWYFKKLASPVLEHKMKRYMTPEEIERWENGIATTTEKLEPAKVEEKPQTKVAEAPASEPASPTSSELPSEPSAIPSGL